jgi:hypothetical protein
MRIARVWAGIIVLVVAAASAQALSVVSSSRTTMIWWTNGTSSDSAPVGYGQWTSDLRGGTNSRAYQSSLISDSELRGNGDVSMWTTGDYSESRYSVTFDLDTSTPYSFFVDNFDSNGCCTWQPTGLVTLDQVGPTSRSIYSVTLGRSSAPGGGQGYPDFSAQGVLDPGRYSLTYDVNVNGSHNAAGPAASGFDFVVVPEPGTGALLAFGLAGLFARRRRR